MLGADADSHEARWLVELGYRSLLMLPLPVESKPFALIEVYDKSARRYADSEIRLSEALALEAGKMVVRARMQEHLEDAYIATLGTLAAALEAKDAYTNDHAAQIAELAAAVCEQLQIAPADMRMIRLAALLHDIGKIGVPETILHKRGPLDEDEWAVMQEHPRIGARILEPVPYFAELVPLVTSSHERYDGTGYPDQLAGDDIPLGSRVIAVCDAFHAMTEDRVYRKAVPVDEALREIVRCSGSQFDPSCVEAMLAVVRTKGWPRFSRDRLVRLAQHAVLVDSPASTVPAKTRSSFPDGYDYSQTIVADGPMVYVSGQGGFGPTAAVVDPAQLRGPAAAGLRQRAGAARGQRRVAPDDREDDRVPRPGVRLRGVQARPRRGASAPYPASTAIVAGGFLFEGMLVEMDAVARVGEPRA